MTTKTELMGLGMPSHLANEIGQDVPVGALTATGTTQAGALAINSSVSIFTTVGSGAGALLPQARSKFAYIVVNNGSNALLVYPNGTEFINGAAASTAISIPAGKSGAFWGAGNQWGAVISA